METWFIDTYWVFCSVAADVCPGALWREAISGHGIQYVPSSFSVYLSLGCTGEFVFVIMKSAQLFTNYKAFSATKTPWVCVCGAGRFRKDGLINVLK